MAALRLLAPWLSPRVSPGLGRWRAGTWDTPRRAYLLATIRIVP